MKRLPKPIYLLFSSLMLASCGMDVKAVYDRSLYHTNIFENNFYVDTVLNTTFAPVNLRGTRTRVDIASAAVSQTIPTSQEDPNGDDFALTNQLSNALPSLDYGIESKLFDGILYCTDAVRASKSRLQLLPSGMAYRFEKSIAQSTENTIGFFMKAGADTNSGGRHITDLVVTFTLYRIEGDGYSAIDIIVPISGLKATFFPGYYQVTLPTNTLVNTIGFSFIYEIINPTPSEVQSSLTGIFLYEVLMPTTTFAI